LSLAMTPPKIPLISYAGLTGRAAAGSGRKLRETKTLLGRIFSPWNMVAYAAGIVFGVLLDRVASRAPLAQDSAHSAS
jgi:predicted metal-binding membrane protein